jgi:Uma2 family endonuclease
VHSRVSFAELERWPEDGRRYELYDGEVYEVPSPILLHQIVAGRLYATLNDHVRQHGGIVVFAPLDIVLTDYDVVQPDLLLFTKEREGLLDLRKANRVAPDLAIEILSPSTAANDRGRKMQLLARHRVREFWLVNPETATIEVFALNGQQFVLASTASGRERVRSPLLPDLALQPADLVPA